MRIMKTITRRMTKNSDSESVLMPVNQKAGSSIRRGTGLFYDLNFSLTGSA